MDGDRLKIEVDSCQYLAFQIARLPYLGKYQHNKRGRDHVVLKGVINYRDYISVQAWSPKHANT
jgi:hypothetical protein